MKTRIVCIFLALVFLFSSVSCSKKASESEPEEKPGCYSATEEFFDYLIASDTKQLKMLEGITDKHIELVNTMTQVSQMKRVINKSYYEIDEDSIIEKKTKAYCEVDVMVPDYSAAVAKLDIKPESFFSDFYDAVDKQNKKDYKTIALEVNFKIKDEEYIIQNADELFVKFYTPLSNALEEYTSQIPEDYGKKKDGFFVFPDLKEVGLSKDVFKSVLSETDPQALEKLAESSVDMDNSDFTLYLSAISGDILYTYVEYMTSDECRKDSETLSYLAKSGGPFYHFEDDWGCSVWQYEDSTYLIYFSGKSQIHIICNETSEENNKRIDAFINVLTGGDIIMEEDSEDDSEEIRLSGQDFVSRMKERGYNIVYDDGNTDENIVESIIAGNEDGSILVVYSAYKDADAASRAFNNYVKSAEIDYILGDFDEMNNDTNKLSTKNQEKYTMLVLDDSLIIWGIVNPPQDESITEAESIIDDLLS